MVQKIKLRKDQKLFAIRVKAPKNIPGLSGFHLIKARNKEIARRKFRKGFRTQLKITGISQVK